MTDSDTPTTIHAYLPCFSKLVWSPCPVCAQSRAQVLLSFDSFGFPIRTVECLHCGQVYANPRPTEEYLRNFYKTKYLYFYEGTKRIDDNHIEQKGLRRLADRRIDRYSTYLGAGVRLLDVGCGAGVFMEEIVRKVPGATVFGIEPDPVSADYAERRLHLSIHRGFLESFPVGMVFDVVTAFHVVEHIYALHEFFEIVRGHLRPGGYFIVETPNCAGKWTNVGMFHIAHLQTFSPRTLANVFRVNGFEVLDARPLEDEIDVSNLLVVGRMTETRRAPELLEPRSLIESKNIAAKCDALKTLRLLRVLRAWSKWAYFAMGGRKD